MEKMNMINIYKKGTESIPLIRSLSLRIWPEAYSRILSETQIHYMLNLMYSDEALETQINQKQHQFILAFEDTEPVGFASYGMKSLEVPGVYRLHKLYVVPGLHGKGVGKKLLQFMADDILLKGAEKLELNVNKQNRAIQFYEKMGFNIIREEKIDIGQGFIMDDYVMETSLPALFQP
jgi:ribosomal protein S18 acetylase RimI-like enzyme